MRVDRAERIESIKVCLPFLCPGLKVAMGMQKQITAKREQIDTLHGRIQLLEETMDKLTEVATPQCLLLVLHIVSIVITHALASTQIKALCP